MVEILNARRKAIVALAVSLVGGLLAVFPDSIAMQVFAAVVTAVATTIGVHQIPNAVPRVVEDLGDVVLDDPLTFFDPKTGARRPTNADD